MERLSVIIPAHNAGTYLQQAVESVRAQQWAGEMEILVVDDGSTDHTAQMALTLGVTLLQKEQGGAACEEAVDERKKNHQKKKPLEQEKNPLSQGGTAYERGKRVMR